MTFDKQEHKDAILALLNQATFPGHLLDQAMELREAVATGVVMKVQPPLTPASGPKPKKAR